MFCVFDITQVEGIGCVDGFVDLMNELKQNLNGVQTLFI
jgi:hypothetical protein